MDKKIAQVDSRGRSSSYITYSRYFILCEGCYTDIATAITEEKKKARKKRMLEKKMREGNGKSH